MDVRRLNRADPAEVRRCWELGRDAEARDRAVDVYVPWPAYEALVREGRPDADSVMLVAHDPASAELVGTASVGLPNRDNLHLADLEVTVHPGSRRRGAGRALVEAAESEARAEGRRTVLTEVVTPVGGPGPGEPFARSLGYTPALEDGLKVVDLRATEHLWPAIEQEVARRAAAYRLVGWIDEVPREHLDGYCRLSEVFNAEAPSGSLELETECWDEDRVRRREASDRVTGRRVVGAAALDRDGAVVGLTEVVLSDHAPARGFQSGTLVLPEHRGHALGLAVKVANHRVVRREFHDCAILITGNADVNAAMNAVNDRLGYHLVEQCVAMRKDL